MALAPNLPQVPDEITRDYQETLEVIRQLEAKSRWWTDTLNHPYWLEYTEQMEKEADEKAISWRRPVFKAKDFAAEQPRVIAIDEVLRSFEEHKDDVRQSLSNARAKKAHLEDQYPLLIGLAPAETQRTATVEAILKAGDEPERAAQGLIVVTAPLNKKVKLDKSLLEWLEKSGFTHTLEENGDWRWLATEDDKSGMAYDHIQGNQERYKSLVRWMDIYDPAQLEIPVEDPEAAEIDCADALGRPEPRECVIVTRRLHTGLLEGNDDDLIAILEGCGFASTKQRDPDPDLEGDPGEEEWTADYSQEMEACMNGLDDERILEKKVR